MSNSDKFLLDNLKRSLNNTPHEPIPPKPRRPRRPRRPLPMLDNTENKALKDLADFKKFLLSADVLPADKRGLVLEHIREYMTDKKSIIDDELFYFIAEVMGSIWKAEYDKKQEPAETRKRAFEI